MSLGRQGDTQGELMVGWSVARRWRSGCNKGALRAGPSPRSVLTSVVSGPAAVARLEAGAHSFACPKTLSWRTLNKSTKGKTKVVRQRN